MTSKTPGDKPLLILLIEDNPDHTELIMRVFEEHRVPNRIQCVADGEAALDYLFRRGPYADPRKSPRPHVILHGAYDIERIEAELEKLRPLPDALLL